MIRNYFKIAWRNLIKNKAFSLINIVGLASGILCTLLIYLWVSDEMAINKYHENIDNLYVVYEKQIINGEPNGGYYTPGLLAEELKLKFPEVELASQLGWWSERTLSTGIEQSKEVGNFVSEDYFSMFSYNFLEGTPKTALASPTNIAISKKLAESYFGSTENAIGKAIEYQNDKTYQVSAVYENASKATTEHFDFYLSWDNFIEENEWAKEWGNNGPGTLLMLADNVDATKFGEKIEFFLKDYNNGFSENFQIDLKIQPYGEQYLNSFIDKGEIAGGKIENVRIFGFIAFFILLIACINFMNLTSARALKRAKEVGVRKVIGANKRSLISQFLGEAILLSFISTILALVVLITVLPYFNALSDKSLSVFEISTSSWFIMFCLALLTGALSGLYPALLLSSFKSIDIFKNKIKFDFAAKWIRQGLVVFQFSLAVVMICGMIITSKQINYFQNKNLGYDRQNLLSITLEGELQNIKYELFKTKITEIPGVTSMTSSNDKTVNLENGTSGILWTGKDDGDFTQFVCLALGYDFTKTWRTEIIDGRDFSKDISSDKDGYILNETAVKAMGLENPVGQPLEQWGEKGTILGVVKDFHFNSLDKKIEPLVIRNIANDGSPDRAFIRINPTNVMQTMAALEAIHTELNPTFPFNYQFTDEAYDNLYKSETVFYSLSQYFSMLAIFISCLGLFGLVMFTAEQKVKEIGIRKALGASVFNITKLLTTDFLKLVAASIIIGTPIAYYLMHEWLNNYEYQVDVPMWTFGVAGVLVIVISIVTISFESIKAALANPVESLKSE